MVRAQPRNWSARRSPGGAMRFSSSPRSCRRMPPDSGTVAACERSLARLRTDRLDCYLLHWRGSSPAGGHGRRLRAASGRRQDPVVGREQLRRARPRRRAERSPGEGHPACNQVLYHLRERAIEQAVLPWCEEHGVAVVAYSPFGHAGGFPGPRTAGGRVLKEIADRHHATPRQAALRFLVRRPSLFAIPKASNPAHAEENAASRSARFERSRVGPDRRGFPARPPPPPAADALAPFSSPSRPLRRGRGADIRLAEMPLC